MQVKIPCSSCGKGLKVLPEHLGKRARCPYCNAAIVLEAPADYVEPAASAPPAGDGAHDARQAIAQALQQHTESLHEWSNHIETLGAVVARHITEGWDQVQQRIEGSQQHQAEQLSALLAELRQDKQSQEQARTGQAAESQQVMAAALRQQTDSLRASAEGMNSIGQTVAQQILAGWEKIQQRLDESHREQLKEIRALLAEAGQEKQQLIEQTRAIQEAQSKQATATAVALADTVAKVRSEVLQLQEAQACTTSAEDSAQSQEVREALISSLRQHAGALREWSGELGTVGAALARQIGEGWDQVQQRLDQAHQKQVKEIRALLAEAAKEKNDLLDQSRAIQEAQLQQAAAAAASLAETAVKVHEQVLQLHEKQAQGTSQIVAALASELQTVQRELLAQSQEQFKAEGRTIHNLVAQATASLADFSQQSQALPAQMKQALSGFGDDLHKQLEASAGHAQGLLSAQAASLTELGKSVGQSAERLDALPQRLALALEACGTQLGQQVKAAAQESQEVLRIPTAALAEVAQSLQHSTQQIAALPAQVGESLTACAGELRRQTQQAAREGEQAFRGQVAALGEMAESFHAGMQQLLALPQHLLAALDAYRAELQQRAQDAGGDASKAFENQLALVGQVGDSIRQSAREFGAQLEQIRSAYAAELAEAMERTKQTTIELQKSLATGTQQSTTQIDELQIAWTVHAQTTTRQLASLHQAFESAATRALEKVERARAGADEAGAQRLQRLSAEAESLLTEVYRRSEQVMRQSWELSARAAAQHDARLKATADQMIASLTQSQESLAQPLGTLNELLQKIDDLAPIEKSLSRSLESLSAGDSLKKTLGSIDQSLGRLNRLLGIFSEQVGVPADAAADDKTEGMSGWIRRHLAKGS